MNQEWCRFFGERSFPVPHFMHRHFSVACLIVGSAVFARSPENAYAANVGQAYDALPGLHRVPLAEPSDARVSAALSMGYGVTEAGAGESGTHQRISTIAAIGVAPLPRLQFGLSAAARYDHHPSDDRGSDSGTVLDPTVSARWVQPLAERFALGFELGAWFPGTEEAARTLRATSPHAALLGTFGAGPLTIGARAGYRFDRSAKAMPDIPELRAGDRLALGLSDFDAALLGMGAAYRIGPAQLFLEGSADLLLGADAPPVLDGPIGASLGGRYSLDDNWSVELLGEGSLSGRPTLAASAPLVPVQPRFAVFAGVRFRLPVTANAVPEPGPEPATAPAPVLIQLRVTVRHPIDSDGAPLRATLQQNGKELSAARVAPDELAFDGVSPGKATLRVAAEGYQPSIREIEISGLGPQRMQVELEAIGPQAQIRGLVRSLGGRGLLAHIRVEPLGLDATADEAGFFELDVPAGRYLVQIEAAGYRAQQKSVVVEKNGVIILNADLLKEP
jgi:hypothetical protein